MNNGEGFNDPDRVGTDLDDTAVTRVEEEVHVGTEEHESGSVRVHKYVESEEVEHVVPRRIERADVGEHIPALEGDSGEIETLEDGSVSIPIFEEELVVTKRLVVRERLIVRKVTEIDEHRLQTELRKERVEITSEGDAEIAAPLEDDESSTLTTELPRESGHSTA